MPRKHMGYATGTEVPVENSQAEVVRILRSRGASQHFFGEDETRAVVGFTMKNRQIRFSVPYPKSTSPGYDAEVRRRWRCLVIALKAKFEMVDVAGSLSPAEAEQAFRSEFLNNTVLTNGQTVGDVVLPMVAQNYEGGGPPLLMLPGMPKEE